MPADVAGSRASMEAILADPARHLLLATVDGEILGTVDLLIAANLTHHCEPWAIIENSSSPYGPGAGGSAEH